MGRPETPPEKPSNLYFARKSRPGITKTKLSRESGIKKQTIDKLEDSRMELTRQYTDRFAKILDYPSERILFWDRHKESVSAVTKPSQNDLRASRASGQSHSAGWIPIVGTAELGAFRQMPVNDDTEESLQRVAAPRSRLYPNARHFALDVRGDSMNAARPAPILDGMIALCVDVIDAEIELESGKIYAVRQTRDGGQTFEVTLKRAKIFRNRVELHPESTNPNYQPLVIPIEHDPASTNEVAAIGWVYFVGYDFERA